MAGRRKDKASKHRRINPRVWDSADFRRLSPAPASGQGMWLHLLASKRMTPIPGLIHAGVYSLAEDTRWTPEEVQVCLKEIEAAGMAVVDWGANLIWLPKAVDEEVNWPTSPNHVKAWAKTWNQTANGEVKGLVWHAISKLCAQLGDTFADAFTKHLPMPSRMEVGRHPAYHPEAKSDAIPHAIPDGSRTPCGIQRAESREQRAESHEEKTASSCAELAPPPAAPLVPVEHVGPEFPCSGTGVSRWRATRAEVDRWSAAFPGVDVEAQLLKAHSWVLASPQRKKTPRGMPRFIHGWLSRTQDRGGGLQGPVSSTNGRGPIPRGGPEVGAGKQAHRPFEEISAEEEKRREQQSLRAEQFAKDRAAQHQAQRTKPPDAVKDLISQLAQGKSIGGGS